MAIGKTETRKRASRMSCVRDPGHARGTRDKHKIGHSIDLPSGKTEPVNYCADRAHPFRSLATLARPVSWKNNEATREPASSLFPSLLSFSTLIDLSHRDFLASSRHYFLLDFNMKFVDINWEFNTYIFSIFNFISFGWILERKASLMCLKRKKQRLNDDDRSRFYGSEIRFNSLCLVEIEINTSFWVYRNERWLSQSNLYLYKIEADLDR